MAIKRYSEMVQYSSFEERFEYLKLSSRVGDPTFGENRYLNQHFYTFSAKWKSAREKVIIRDEGCDLGIPGMYIFDKVFVHHMNPVSMDDILADSDFLYDPEYLICVSMNTHNAIHYGAFSKDMAYKERAPNDTIFW